MGCSSSAATSSPSAPGLHVGAKIGTGSYAQVHMATIIYQNKAKAAAVKVRDLDDSSKTKVRVSALRSSLNEVLVWRAVGNHRNCVQLLESFFDDRLSYMVMERCHSSLLQYLRGSVVVNEISIGRALHQMLNGISHLHSVSIVHRDVKPDNFLVNGDTIKICDFGLSAFLPKTGFLGGAVGTAPYMSPEMLTGRVYNENVDVWAFGIVAYLLLCGEFPYKTVDGSSRMMKESIVRGGPADFDKEWLSKKARNFLGRVLTRDPLNRPSAKAASICADLAFDLSSEDLQKPSGERLPSLLKILTQAERTGAFCTSSISSVTNVDRVLQKMNDGVPLASSSLSLMENISGKSFTEENVAHKELMTPAFSDGKFSMLQEPQTTSGSIAGGSSPYSEASKSTTEGWSEKEKLQFISEESKTTCDDGSVETGCSAVSKQSTEFSMRKTESSTIDL